MSTLLEDTREIQKVYSVDGDWWAVGLQGVTAIKAYGEPGQYCYLPWFAIYKGDTITGRVNGAHVVDVVYREDNNEDAYVTHKDFGL